MSLAGQDDLPRIFSDPSNGPARIFIDPSVSFRPKLLRKLRKMGAEICHNPRDSRFILVELDTNSGRQFVRDWGQNPSKDVLECRWVDECAKACRLLLASENWGGCLAIDDGLPIGDDDEQVTSRPLPTPRPTPVSSDSIQSPPAVVSNLSEPENAIDGIPMLSNTQTIPLSGSRNTSVSGKTSLQLEPKIVSHLPLQQSAASPSQFPPAPDSLYMQQNAWIQQLLASQESYNYPKPTPQQTHIANDRSESNHREISSSLSLSYDSQSDSYHSNAHISASKSAIARSPAISDASNEGKNIFMGLKFFVQVDLRDRKTILGRIKGCGGIIRDQITGSDYAVLTTRSTTFRTLFKDSLSACVPAVQSSFINDSVQKGFILEESDYAFELPQSLKRKLGVKKSTSKRDEGKSRKASSRSPSKEQKLKTPIKARKRQRSQSPGPKPAKRPKSRGKLTDEKVSLTRTPSPIPPPDVTIPGDGMTRYSYTSDERKYMTQYIKHLLKGCPKMTTREIAGRLSTKMPKHNARSWAQFIQSKAHDELEELRKRAVIADRKASYEGKTSHEDIRVDTQSREPSVVSVSQSPPSHAPEHLDSLEKQDFDIILDFFLKGGAGDDKSEEQVWDALAQQATCRTCPTWEHFYQKHGESVLARFNALSED